jgi:hypothetical protein
VNSPFKVGALITERAELYGRTAELAALRVLLFEVRNHVHLVGERKIGKTSLIRTLINEADRGGSSVLCVYGDVSRFVCESWADVYRSIVEITHEQLEVRSAESARQLDAEVSRLRDSRRQAETVGAFNGYFRALCRNEISVVLVLDELAAALRHFGNEPMHFNHLRYVAQSRDQYDVTVLTCDRRTWNDIAPETGGSPGLNFINQTMRIRAIPEKEVSRLLREAASRGGSGIEFSESDVAFIVQHSGSVPYLVQLLGEQSYLLKLHRVSIAWPELADDVYRAVRSDLMEQFRVCTEREKAVLRRMGRSGFGLEDSDALGIGSLGERGILVQDGSGRYKCYSPFFERVSREQDGVEERGSKGSVGAVLLLHHRDDVSEAILKLRGSKSVEAVEEWLLNFSGDEERKFALKLLKNVRYFDLHATRQWCAALHGRLSRELGEAFNRAVFITFGGPAKSGAAIARYYYAASGVDAQRFRSDRELGSISSNGAFVLLDDFIGSGSQITRYWERLSAAGKSAEWVCAALLGYKEGVERIKAGTGIRVVVNELLTERDKVFSTESSVFDRAELPAARLTFESYGNRLFQGHPLGYEDGQALVAFHDSVPNNTLPVIWSERMGWKPIFRRHGG